MRTMRTKTTTRTMTMTARPISEARARRSLHRL
jgi:hypothetical protein